MLRVALAPLRTIVAITGLVLATLVFGTAAFVVARTRPRSPWVNRIIRAWGRSFLFVTGTRVRAEGLDHIDRNASYVFTGNHTSNIDIAVTLGVFPVSARYLAKKELFRVPVLGPAMRSVLMVETDRTAGTAAHRAINEQVDRVMDAGLSLVIHPEGTRSRSGELLPFKKGAFRIAIDNGLPVVPFTLVGADRVWPPGGWFVYGGPVRVVIHPPIPTVGLGPGDIDDLRDRVRGIVADSYQQLRVDR